MGFTTNVGTNVNDQSNNPASFLPYALSSNSLAPGVQLQWRLFDGMGMFAAKDRLTLLAEQANGNADLMVESTVQAVLAAYDNALVQEEAANVLRAALDLTRQRLARVEASVNLGAAGTFDRLQFDNALWTDSTALIRQEAAVRAAQRNLNLLLAQEEGMMWTLTSELITPTASDDLPALQKALAASNQSIQNAVLSTQLAETGVKQAQARLYPVVGLTSNWNASQNVLGIVGDEIPDDLPPNFTGDLTTYTMNYGAALTLNFNLFNGGVTKRTIQQAQIQVELAMLDQERLVAEAQAALAAAWDRQETAVRVHDMAWKRVANAQLAADIGADRYRDGILNAMDFRALDVALLQAEASELAARQEWAAAHWEVMRLVGGLRGGLVEY